MLNIGIYVEMSFQGENVPAPFMSFEAAGFPADLLKEVMAAYIRRCGH